MSIIVSIGKCVLFVLEFGKLYRITNTFPRLRFFALANFDSESLVSHCASSPMVAVTKGPDEMSSIEASEPDMMFHLPRSLTACSLGLFDNSPYDDLVIQNCFDDKESPGTAPIFL